VTDVKHLIDTSKISTLQIGVIAVCMIMNMLDGMDVMVISYTAPSLSEEWGIAPSTLGVVFSMALFGMALGAAFLAPLADTFGRRNIILACIVVMGGGVLLTSSAQTVLQLAALRFVSGLGIGAMLASTVTLSSEYAPERQKNFVVGIVLAGYPIGATLSGLIAAQIIPAYGWRTMFITAGMITFVSLPLAYFLCVESWEWLLKKQPEGALVNINNILKKMNHPGADDLPEKSKEAMSKPGVSSLFIPERKDGTVKLWIAFFTGFATLYFLTAWIPNLARGTGLSIELAIYAGTIFNLGAIFGNLSQGYLSQIIGLKKAIVLFYGLTTIFMVIFAYLSGNLAILLSFGIIGFGVQGGLIGLWTVGAKIYPTEIRNTGLGWAAGAGRTGAIVSPTIGGFLVGAGLTMASSFIVFVFPLLIACISVSMMKNPELAPWHRINGEQGLT
jgi:AAHS family 4-hydroxybenzoate transporter-like MFS transporter